MLTDGFPADGCVFDEDHIQRLQLGDDETQRVGGHRRSALEVVPHCVRLVFTKEISKFLISSIFRNTLR